MWKLLRRLKDWRIEGKKKRKRTDVGGDEERKEEKIQNIIEKLARILETKKSGKA